MLNMIREILVTLSLKVSDYWYYSYDGEDAYQALFLMTLSFQWIPVLLDFMTDWFLY